MIESIGQSFVSAIDNFKVRKLGFDDNESMLMGGALVLCSLHSGLSADQAELRAKILAKVLGINTMMGK
jgi:hypothetical protein